MLGLLKILAAFAAIVFMVRKKVHLGTAMVLGAVILAFLSWAGWTFLGSGTAVTPGDLLSIITNALWDSSSDDPSSILKLIGVVVLVLVLSHCLEKTGQMNRIMRNFQGLARDARFVMVALPALIGLLPMPGGAVFSAPMVEEAQKGMNLSPSKKALFNYWFRHIWEYSWPLYPGLLLAAELARKCGLHLSVFKLGAIQSPLTAAALLGGIIFIVRKVPKTTLAEPDGRKSHAVAILAFDLLPILAILGVVVILSAAAGMESKDSLLIALVAAILLTLATNALEKRMPPTAALKGISVARILSLVYMIVGLMIFRETIQNSGAVNEISAMMKAHHVPLLPFIVILSFVTGLVTGLAMAYVGILFPIFTPLILQATSDPLPFLVLVFGCGFIGLLFSPVHVCLVLTYHYFNSDLSSIYRGMVRPVLVVFGALIALFFALYLTPLSG